MKNKFNIGDNIWYIKDGKAIEAKILGVATYKIGDSEQFIYTTTVSTSYSVSMYLNERDLFATKEDLIASL